MEEPFPVVISVVHAFNRDDMVSFVVVGLLGKDVPDGCEFMVSRVVEGAEKCVGMEAGDMEAG
jgi:hypothetical protein